MSTSVSAITRFSLHSAGMAPARPFNGPTPVLTIPAMGRITPTQVHASMSPKSTRLHPARQVAKPRSMSSRMSRTSSAPPIAASRITDLDMYPTTVGILPPYSPAKPPSAKKSKPTSSPRASSPRSSSRSRSRGSTITLVSKCAHHLIYIYYTRATLLTTGQMYLFLTGILLCERDARGHHRPHYCALCCQDTRLYQALERARHRAREDHGRWSHVHSY